MRCNKRDTYSNKKPPQEMRKMPNKHLDFTPKATRKRKTKIPKLVEEKKL